MPKPQDHQVIQSAVLLSKPSTLSSDAPRVTRDLDGSLRRYPGLSSPTPHRLLPQNSADLDWPGAIFGVYRLQKHIDDNT
ncbi:hypothetical protein K435DRAFT_874463 [Dendrothele bispora CBS 962.96]|uniref:Uncharacterized protein n=1 Tax=Dendrothele bispora (strain CBS 962.96) TaxID=1314807 RepID=A0A4S8KX14_DENBC|nr:hypothetical protein K435DRAFT_874463 [Dendrothele bispora CBS 962.96]